MFDLVVEGVDSLRLPCSWVILLPALGITVFARRRNALTIVIFTVAAALVAWVRFAGWWFAVPDGAEQIVIGLVLAMATVAAWRIGHPVGDGALAAAVAVAAVSAWIPCVGPHLGELLNEARSAPWANAPGTLAFVLGLMLPFVMVPALLALIPKLDEFARQPTVIATGAVVLLVFATLFATTLLDDVASGLARRSTF
jgi:cytochrome c biogenesis protein CcdA